MYRAQVLLMPRGEALDQAITILDEAIPLLWGDSFGYIAFDVLLKSLRERYPDTLSPYLERNCTKEALRGYEDRSNRCAYTLMDISDAILGKRPKRASAEVRQKASQPACLARQLFVEGAARKSGGNVPKFKQRMAANCLEPLP